MSRVTIVVASAIAIGLSGTLAVAGPRQPAPRGGWDHNGPDRVGTAVQAIDLSAVEAVTLPKKPVRRPVAR